MGGATFKVSASWSNSARVTTVLQPGLAPAVVLDCAPADPAAPGAHKPSTVITGVFGGPLDWAAAPLAAGASSCSSSSSSFCPAADGGWGRSFSSSSSTEDFGAAPDGFCPAGATWAPARPENRNRNKNQRNCMEITPPGRHENASTDAI